MSDSPNLPFFFWIHADSTRLVPIRAKTGRFRRKREPIQPKHADTVDSRQNGHQNRPIQPIPAKTGRNGQQLPFFCFMWPCEREKKKKKEKEEEYEKTQKKMDGRRIKVCNKTGRLNQIGADSGQNRPIPAETGTYTAKHADTANSGRNRPKWAAAAILLLNVAL